MRKMLFPDTKKTVTFKGGDSIQTSSSASTSSKQQVSQQQIDIGWHCRY